MLERTGNTGSDRPERGIARGLAVAVVDVAELIDVEEAQHRARTIDRGAHDRALESFQEMCSAQRRCERVFDGFDHTSELATSPRAPA
jgi:hypothetical protein